MIKKSFRVCAIIATIIIANGCDDIEKKREVVQHITQVQSTYAPDKRTALFDVNAIDANGIFKLTGETNLPKAVDDLTSRLTKNSIAFENNIDILPAEDLRSTTRALVNISVANLRSKPKHSAELATQATLGTPLKVLKKQDDWYYVQTPDHYLSWVDSGGITLKKSEELQEWQSAEKVIYTETFGHAYAQGTERQIVSDLVAGNILQLGHKNSKGTPADRASRTDRIDNTNRITNNTPSDNINDLKVQFPDGRLGVVPRNEVQNYDTWLKNLNPTADSLISLAHSFMGVPYLWGGTSTKGMDCSGFTKTLYFMNGMIIPRDASQQVLTGKSIDSTANFENVKKGDLLFFGRKANDSTPEKVVHVGMYIGNKEFIHASEMVRVSSIDPAAQNYDAFNRNRYLRTQRILGEKGEGLINLSDSQNLSALEK